MATDSATFTESGATACTALCESVRNTFNSHVRAVFYFSVVMLITNLVLVLWVLALRSDRLWRRVPQHLHHLPQLWHMKN